MSDRSTLRAPRPHTDAKEAARYAVDALGASHQATPPTDSVVSVSVPGHRILEPTTISIETPDFMLAPFPTRAGNHPQESLPAEGAPVLIISCGYTPNPLHPPMHLQHLLVPLLL